MSAVNVYIDDIRDGVCFRAISASRHTSFVARLLCAAPKGRSFDRPFFSPRKRLHRLINTEQNRVSTAKQSILEEEKGTIGCSMMGARHEMRLAKHLSMFIDNQC